jgi:hypothetical protein
MNNNNSPASRHHPGLDHRQAAERRLCRLFASFGIDALLARERLIDPFIERAGEFRRSHRSLDLATLAADEAEMELGRWFTALIGLDEAEAGSLPASGALMTGRAAFLMCAGPARFADMFLRPLDELSAEFIAAVRDHAPLAVPPSEHGDMHHQPYQTWSLRHVLAWAVPVDRSMMPMWGLVFRRDGRNLGFGWRNTGSTS